MGNAASTAACDIVTHRVQYLTSTVEESKMSKPPVHLVVCGASLWENSALTI